ncbi:MFS transporter [Amycolatopsis thermoflava]
MSVADPAVVKRAVGAAAIGNITEWYDFGVYGYLTTTISKVFFTDLSGPVATIATFGLFAVSFLIRPFGGLFFGPLSDRIGRKRVLSLTVVLMALGTFAIGVVPGYEAIGIAAPLLVLFARLVQGVSTGGEYGSAMTFIAEYAPDRRRGFLGSWLEFGTLTGYAFGATIATVLTAVLTEDQLLSWGWRIPFLIALPIGLVVLSLPAVLLLRVGGNVATFAGLAVMGLTLVCFSSTLPSTLPAMFPTHIRAGALSIAFNISVSLFGGTTSTVMGALVAGTGDLNWPAYYLIAAGVVGAICIYLTRESAGRPLQGSPAIVSPEELTGSRR